MMKDNILWHNPLEKIWGFHVHQELSLEDFPASLVIQQNCAEFLGKHNIIIDAADVIKPGYGPHLNYMWELRVESDTDKILEKLGLAIAYMAVNRFGLTAYIHPLMHDPALSEEQALAQEGRDNQANALWFSYKIPQKQEFFFNPPKDENNNIIDTRSMRIMSTEERERLYNLGKNKLSESNFVDPAKTIINGFHIHLDFYLDQEDLALAIFDNFLVFLLQQHLRPTSTRLYGMRENGPHVQRGWEVKFEVQDQSILERIGIAIAWLMCNRQGQSIFIHPVTWHEGDHREELKAHQQYAFFLGELPELDLSFFSNKIPSAESV